MRLFLLLFTFSLTGVNGYSNSQNRGQNQVQILSKLNIDRDRITLSGFSSGGTFAQMLQFSYPKLFSGIGVFSHTYYRCGPPSGVIEDYDAVCTKIGLDRAIRPYDVQNVFRDIENYVAQGLIDSPSFLSNKKLYVYTGTNNSLFTTDQSLKIIDIYSRYLKHPSQICTRVQTAELNFPTSNFGGECDIPGDDNFFLANCKLNGAHDCLNFLYGHIKPPYKRTFLQPLNTFNQREFFTGISGRIDMDDIGYIYTPTNCKSNAQQPRRNCLLHIYFHGCLTGREYNGTNHIRNSGYLEIAEVNNIVVIFPQALRSLEVIMVVFHKIGWDTFGLTGEFYATKMGSQVSVVHNIIKRVTPATTGTAGQVPDHRKSQSIKLQATSGSQSRYGK